MCISLNCNEWAKDTFGDAALGDKRLTKRLELIAAQLSSSIGTSLAASCNGDEAALEGSYRFIRNNQFTAENIAEGGFLSTVRKSANRDVLLAIEDTTSLAFTHNVREQLGDLGGPKNAHSRGFIVHTSLMLDGETEETLGLIDQNRWCRDAADRGKKHQRDNRPYDEKESYKWEENSRVISERMGDLMPNVISVCDREADVYEYISYKIENNQRFIVRASNDRNVEDTKNSLFAQISEAKKIGEYCIEITQKGGRKARAATIILQAKEITIMPPERKVKNGLTPLTINVVFATEENCPKDVEPLQWILITTEDISSFANARKITRYYELRWRIEEFHKAWKSGAGAEEQRMQDANNLEKMVVLLAFIAVRLLQLKEGLEKEKIEPSEKIPCTTMLSKEEWAMLWFSTYEHKALPKKPESLKWAYCAIAKLGGWVDSKRTGKASWATIWKGWFKLQERIIGCTTMCGRRHYSELKLSN